jgi:hypothetical protein
MPARFFEYIKSISNRSHSCVAPAGVPCLPLQLIYSQINLFNKTAKAAAGMRAHICKTARAKTLTLRIKVK